MAHSYFYDHSLGQPDSISKLIKKSAIFLEIVASLPRPWTESGIMTYYGYAFPVITGGELFGLDKEMPNIIP